MTANRPDTRQARTQFAATVHSLTHPADLLCLAVTPVDSTLYCDYWRLGLHYHGKNHAGLILALGRLYVTGSVQLEAGDNSIIVLVEASWSAQDDPSTDGATWAQVSAWGNTDGTCDRLCRVRESNPSDRQFFRT